jgi:hypothetical protein
MDVNATNAVATTVSRAGNADAVSVAMLLKALELQTQSAAQLVQAATQTTTNPPNLGNQVNTFV